MQRIRTRTRTLLLLAAALPVLLPVGPAAAQTLDLVEIHANTLTCMFSPTCSFVVQDSSSTVVIPGVSGSGYVQSRTADPAPAGTAAAGLIPYQWRVDLTGMKGGWLAPCVRRVAFVEGEITPLNYDWDRMLEDVFVVTGGGMGSKGPVTALLAPWLTWEFDVRGGGLCPGQSSYFFGLASPDEPVAGTIYLELTNNTLLAVEGRVPVRR